jgi:DNA polymerase-3 subunit beta
VKFQVNKDVLSEAVSFVVRILPQKVKNQILGGILIEADANALRISVFDYEVSAQIETVAKVEDPGRILVSSRWLSEITSRLPNAPVEFETSGTKLYLRCGSSNFTIPTLDIDAYPTLPELPPVSGSISGEAMADAVSQVAFAASKDDVSPWMTCVQIETTPKQISFVATDKYRIAVKEIDWQSKATEDLSALVPAKTLQEIAKTFANQTDVSVAIRSAGADGKEHTQGMIAFKANNRSVTSYLVKDNFPPVRSYFPKEASNYCVVASQDLIDATRRIALVLDNKPAAKYTFAADQVVLEASDAAEASETMPAELSGKELEVKMKPQFVIEGVSAAKSEFVKIIFTNNDQPDRPGPVLISAHGQKDTQDSYRYLLQPNRF